MLEAPTMTTAAAKLTIVALADRYLMTAAI
jgi:hypothetical protein